MVKPPQRWRWVLGVSAIVGATLLARRAASRQEPTVVRDRPRAGRSGAGPMIEVAPPVVEIATPVVEVPAPVVQVVPQESSRGESTLRRIAGVLALLGVVTYAYLTVVYDRFYGALHVDPADVGRGYATTLSHSIGLIVIAVAILGVLLLVFVWIAGSLGMAIGAGTEFPQLLIVPILALLVGVAALWIIAPVLTYPYAEPTREASIAARAVLAGKPVAQVRLANLITVIDLRAEAVTLAAARPGNPAVTSLAKRTDLLYLGKADATVVFFDPKAHQPLYLPADAVLIRLSRPAPRQGRSPLCMLMPPPSWWHGPGWLRDRLPQTRGC
jgi:hypothetical protein